mgnify:CR=1 FL=1
MRVIDSSALIKYFTRESNWDKVKELMSEGVISLDLAIKELANALWKKILRKEIDLGIAVEILKDLIENKPILIEHQENYLIEALDIAIKHRITIYDALFIVLAKKKSMELITSDETQARVAQTNGVRVIIV